MDRFSLLDRNDPNGDCKPDFTPTCDEGYDQDQFYSIELTNIDWPYSDYVHVDPTDEESCKTFCLQDCFCAVAIYRDQQCWKKKLPLSNGRKDPLIVVKVFLKSRKSDFHQRTPSIFSTTHKSQRSLIVVIVGTCVVVIFLSNGVIFGDMRPSWKLRSDVILGIAKGLAYLHGECSTQVIHCDIKPQNILLDDCYNAKISDFGLAKLLMMDQSRTSTGIRGTKGYVAPEWFRNTPVTVMVDVYSFGVLLLEMISCRKSVIVNESDSKDVVAVLTDWAWDCYQEGKLDVFLENDSEALDDYKRLMTFVKVGLWCVQENPLVRPTMRKVIQMVEGVVEVNKPPCPFPFSVTYN
ncbi:putative protein kinase RLK-Pelle-SD-2b family [Helianthus annuus]|uniref:Protein kinase domain-containing protein n=1 Tax=Helianthus annuus TaxID=4232 RepID=A0A9K3INP6_HELAN|nr:putative protein kinase RLK-Pelle-SD-2b family [Helianthus annuus]KAJ0564553.1 putative protein kinase RLK-Pelle-SD-2b family [Helianthus annuus]KAJ0729871.1 putative protein kinase RLK-Pelle-SD-2b family [Helianthus annuus]